MALKKQGETAWSELYVLGEKFISIKKRIDALSEKDTTNIPDLDKEWIRFETEEELEKLRRKGGKKS